MPVEGSISDVYTKIKTETEVKRNQTRFAMVMMDAKAVVVEDVRCSQSTALRTNDTIITEGSV